ncbi:MAG: class I SAM-dependent methyltransferase [Acidobacteriota bacterium]
MSQLSFLQRVDFRLRRELSRFPWLKRRLAAIRNRLLGRFRRERAAEYWDERVEVVESAQPQGWLDLELIEREHLRPRLSGDPDVYYLQHFLATWVPERPVERMLSLGCGGGNLERAFLDLGAARAIDANDVSAGSIEHARRAAAEAGYDHLLTYEVLDLDAEPLPANRYDVVVAKQSLHHVAALEHVYEQIARALKPGGVFMFHEFVGPTRFQWSDRQLYEVNRLLAELPPDLRRRTRQVRVGRPTIEDMIAMDPSEAVRSAEILPLLEERFEILERKDLGGTLLHLVVHEALHVLDLERPDHLAILRGWMQRESELLDAGDLPSDFAYVVARPRHV